MNSLNITNTKPHNFAVGRFDMHTHSQNSHDSTCPIADMAKSAFQNNLQGFAVTDHCDIRDYKTLDLHKAIQNAFKEIDSCQTDKLTILKGIEIGEGFYFPEITASILSKYNFDVVLGSVHSVRLPRYEMYYSGINFSEWNNDLISKYLDTYFDDILYMLEVCDFDILSHLTCPLRYINGKYKIGFNVSIYENKITKILKNIINRNIALEINTSCMSSDGNYREFMPEAWIIELYKSLGGYLITTGSDAHTAANSAIGFNELYAFLKQLGFKHTYYYKNRHAVQCALN